MKTCKTPQTFQIPRPVLLCALAVALGLTLPFVVFAAWDAALLASPHAQAAPAGLSAQGRADPTACLLYGCAHTLIVATDETQIRQGAGWTETDYTPALAARTQAALQKLCAAGLLDEDFYRNLTRPTGWYWRATTASGTLVAVEGRHSALYAAQAAELAKQAAQTAAQTPETAQTAAIPTVTADTYYGDEDAFLTLLLTPEDVPVYLDYQQHGLPPADPARPGALQAYLSLAGLDDFADWQTVDWAGRIPDAGEVAYSPTAQLYATANYRSGVNLSLTSLTAEEMEEVRS